MSNRLIIIGAGGHGKVVADIAMKMNRWLDISFLDDDINKKEVLGLKVIGNISDAFSYFDIADIFVAIGNNTEREKIQQSLEDKGAIIPVLIHPDAVIGQQVHIEIGTVIMPGVIINCCTKIGKGCIINTGAIIDHDNVIEDYVHISPGSSLAGNVKVGKKTWIGIGSVVSNNISICSNCILGAGTVAINDISEPGTYIGIPARKLANC